MILLKVIMEIAIVIIFFILLTGLFSVNEKEKEKEDKEQEKYLKKWRNEYGTKRND